MKIARTLMLPALALLPLAALAEGRTQRGVEHVRARHLRAEVRVVDGVATTRLELTVANDGPRQEEATWILPVPEGSVADDFRMTVNGVEMSGDVLAADRARSVYQGIVRARRDPGLLEYVGRACLRARVFPIPSRGELEVAVTYREILPEVGGVRRWSFPLGAAGLAGRAPEAAVLDLSIESKRVLHNVFSPTPGLQVVKQDDYRARASFEGAGKELAVFYGLSEKEFGLDLLSTRAAGADEGTFLMLVSPRREVDAERVARKSITFVLDTSGSMAGKKIEQARGALRFFLSSLRPGDLFNVIPFATEAQPFFRCQVEVTPENVQAALARVATLEATGGTNIHGALQASLESRVLEGHTVRCGAMDTARVSIPVPHIPIVVFLTDGRPTVQVTDQETILARAKTWNTQRSRIFVFGVGDDVNTLLLDTLAADSGGTRGYVRPHQDIEVETSALFGKLSRPVLSDLALEVEGVELTRVVPARLPDLFHGSRLTIFGRYRGEGPRAIRLTGKVNGERREYVYEGTFAAQPQESFDFVPSLWAQRRVSMLLDEMRLHGKSRELEDEVRRLGRKHQIVTPYTSHLIVEDGLAIRAPSSGAGGARGHGGTYVGPGDAVPPGAGGGGGGGGPGTPGPATPGSPGARRADDGAELDRIARSLRDAGVLPKDTPPAELRRLAREVADELRAADRALRGLGANASGERAVDDSTYLGSHGVLTGSDDFFLGHAQDRERTQLLQRFTRKVKDRIFALRLGVWTDASLPKEDDRPRVVVEAFSEAYFELLEREPRLLPYFAFSSRLVVALDGVVYEVRVPLKRPLQKPVQKGT